MDDTPERPEGAETPDQSPGAEALAAATPTAFEDPDLDFDQPPVAVIPIVTYDPALDQRAFAYEPAVPPKPALPPRSVAGAALLNLTGLGLGYAYLRDRAMLVVALVGTASLVATAFVTDAAGHAWVWRGITLGWLVGLGAHAAYLAGRRGPGAAQRKPVLAGVAAVVVVAAAYAGYGFAGAGAYDRGVAAQAAGDCATALDEFEAVTGPYELTLSSDVLDAGRRVTECADFQKGVEAGRRRDYDTAIAVYERLRTEHPDSPLTPYIRANLADTHFVKATSWREPVTMVDARVSVDTLLMLRREFADTPAGKKAPKAIADMFAAAAKPYGEGKFCDSLPVLQYFAGLAPSSAGKKVVADANAYRARSLYECGLGQVRQNQYTEATATLGTFLTAYPNDGGVPQARSALIAAKVAAAAQVPLPVPAPFGGNDPGRVLVTFYNDSASPVTVLVAGPTAHEITIPGCPSCPDTYPKDDPAACADRTGRPSVTTHLLPDSYYFTTENSDLATQATGPLDLRGGGEFWQCMYKENP